MSILSLADWLDTPQGRYLLGWEQTMLDHLATNIFGYHALQVGLAEVDFLRTNRMPFRFRSAHFGKASVMACAEALPFASASLDLVVLPHVLEFSTTPHQVLREVERVLVQEGSVILTGFNPYSLWGLRRMVADGHGAFPWRGQYMSPFRIKDWMTLLGMENQAASFGGFVPPVRSEQWLERWRFMDNAGARWWPVCGAAYVLHGIKRVQGMRLITPNWRERRAAGKRMAPLAERGRSPAGTGKTH